MFYEYYLSKNKKTSGFHPSQASAYWDFGTASNLAINNDGTGGAPSDTNTIKWATDLSGHGHHMREHTGESAPVWSANSLNGKGTAAFDGTMVMECVDNLTHANQQFTIIAIGKRSGVGNGLTAFFTAGVTSYTVAGGAWFQIQTPESADWQLEASGGPMDVNSGVDYGSRYEMFTIVRDGNTPLTTLYTGGESRVSGAHVYTIANSGAAFIGNWSTANGVYSNIAAIMFFDSALTDTQRKSAELYLANRFGIWAPNVSWPTAYESFYQASILDNKLNVNEIGGSRDTLKYFYDAQDIDALGTSNASLTNHDVIATWKNKGSVGATGDATQSTANYKPTIEKAIVNGTYAGVAFGGNDDYMAVGGAAANLSFIQNTGIFEIIVVGRRDIPNESVIISNTELVAEKGFDLKFTGNAVAAINIYNGSGAAMAQLTCSLTVPVGDTYFLNTFGDALGFINMSFNDWSGFDSSFVSGTFGTGDCTNATYIGMHTSDNVESYDGALYKVAIYSANLSPEARAIIKNDVRGKYIDAVPNYKIACLGDSITIDYQVADQHPYPHRLEQLLGPGYIVGNIAESGYTASQLKTLLYEDRVKTQAYDTTNLDYDLFTLMIGVNDMRVGSSATTIFNTYTSAVIDDIFAHGRTLIPMTITPFNNYSSAWTSDKQTQLETYNGAVKLAAIAYGVKYVDTYELLKNPYNPTAMLPAFDKGDNLHPSHIGNYLIAYELYNKISGTKIQEWRDGVSVGNFDNSSNWQEISGGAISTEPLNKHEYSWVISDSPANQLAVVKNKDASNQGVWDFHSPAPTFSDLEDIASARFGGVSYLYIADIGDNGSARSTFQIVRAIEPVVTGSNGTIPSADYELITCAYPGGADAPTHNDAECLLVDPSNGDMYVITKRESVPGVYKLAHASSYSGTQTLTYMGKMYDIPDITTSALGATACNVTGGCISPDGTEIFIKNYNDVYLFTRSGSQTIFEALQGTPTALTSYVGGGSVTPAKSHPNAEPQGEAVWFDATGRDYFTASEYVTGQGSTATTYPMFRYQRGILTTTTISFQDGVSPSAAYTGTTTTYIQGTTPDTVRGSETTFVIDITVGNALDDRRGLCKWDLSSIPTTATVVGARVDWWISAEGQGWQAHRMLVNWDASSTYNTLVGGADNDGTKATIAISWQNGVNLDTILNVSVRDNAMIADVQDMVTNPSTNYGWLFKNMDTTTGDGVQFDGKNGATASRRPKLTVRYYIPS